MGGLAHRRAPDQGDPCLRHPPTPWQAEQPYFRNSVILLDTDGAIALAYRAIGTPTFVLVDPSGELAGRGGGPRDWTGEHGVALIQASSRPEDRDREDLTTAGRPQAPNQGSRPSGERGFP